MNEGERQVAPTRDGIRRDHVARYAWAAQRMAGGYDFRRVLDFACGVGYGAQLLAQKGHRVVGCDLDAEALDYAREHYADACVEYRQKDAARPGKLGQFDAAVCFETIEHLEDPRPLLSAMRSASPVLFASVPNEDVMPWRGYAYHHRHYTPTDFAELLAACGWRIREWWGQAGTESDVVRNCLGRTLVVVAEHGPVLKAWPSGAPIPAAKAPNPVPESVAILGLGPSVKDFMELAKRQGGRRSLCDEVWAINALGDVLVADRIFHMDDVRIQEIRARARPDSNIATMLKWLKTHPGPIYTSRPSDDYPGTVAYPLEDVVRHLNFAYFNSTAAYAVAYAVHLGVKKLMVFGNDFTYAHSHSAEKGRACVEFWLGQAAARGIKLVMPKTSSLMDACNTEAERVYGYDTLEVKLQQGADGRLAGVRFRPRAEPLPDAAEIERRYDHTAHPNPLVLTEGAQT